MEVQDPAGLHAWNTYLIEILGLIRLCITDLDAPMSFSFGIHYRAQVQMTAPPWYNLVILG